MKIDQAKNETAGRCWTCATIYLWPTGRKRRLVDARCPDCGHLLQQTTVANIRRRITVSRKNPLFY